MCDHMFHFVDLALHLVHYTTTTLLVVPEKKYIMFWLSDQLTWRAEVG